MNPTTVVALGLLLALGAGGRPSGPAALVVAQLPAGEVARGIPVREREAPPDDPVVDQADADADAKTAPAIEQPAVADPPDVEQPDDDQ